MLQVTPIRIRVGVRMTISKKSIVKDPEKMFEITSFILDQK